MQKAILQAVIDEPTLLKTVTLPPKNRLARISQRLGITKPETISLEVKGASLRTTHKISLMILALETNSELPGNDGLFDLMQANAYQQAAIIATAIHNHNSPVPERLVNIILDHFTNEEIKEISEEVYRRLDIQSFFDCTALVKSMGILSDTPETIASQPLSETSNSATN